MSEFKNFRITLHLTHFFQDHRSLCKIFITEKMKNIQDLQNHVQKIFKITDFCLISSGHYVSPCEDIRVLHPDDSIVAIPTNRTICATSTPIIITTNSEIFKKTNEGQYLEDREQFSECNLVDYSNMHAKKKKKKEKNKRILDSDIRYDNEQHILHPNKGDAGQEHNIEFEVNTADKNKKQKKSKTNIVQNEKSGKTHTKQKFPYDFPNLGISDVSQIDPNSSAKTKIIHSAKQPLNDESINRQILVPKINNIENEEHEINNIDLPMAKKMENSFNCIKDKSPKLYIRKRKSDLICYDLPKKSNIVKNILVSNITGTINGAQTNADDQFSENHNPLLSDWKKSVQDNKFTFPNSEKLSCHIKNNVYDEHSQIKINNSQNKELEYKKPAVGEITSNSGTLLKTINISSIYNFENSELGEECSINEKYKYLTSVNKPEESLEYKSMCLEKHVGDDTDVMSFKQPTLPSQSGNLDIPVPLHREITSNSSSLLKTINIDTIGNFENSDLREECNINEKYKYKDSTSVTKPEENLEYRSMFFEKHTGDDTDVMHFKQPPQPSQSENFDIPFCAKEPQQIVNISLGGNTIDDDHSCSTVSDKYDTVSFITKRKRKRTHRKRKSKTGINGSPISSTAQSDNSKCVSPFTATSALHIKFNDDGEPINCTEHQQKVEEQLENVPSQVIDNVMNTTVQTPESDKISKLDTLIHENKSSINNNIFHGTINDTTELDNKVSISGMLSEDIIFKSPIMTSTKPKPRDLIAFKMLRLTENYTPEVSKHIIGEILSFNEITSNVDLKIIDGLDQCAQPGGKFSLEDSDRELCRTKSYCWTSLIEPRLIFP